MDICVVFIMQSKPVKYRQNQEKYINTRNMEISLSVDRNTSC